MINVEAKLFASLPEPALERIRQAVQTRRYAPNEVMISEGELRDELCIILTGEAVVVGSNWHGEPQKLASLGPGECFGELSMLSGEPASATVSAVTDTEISVLSHADFIAIANDFPELSRNLSALLGERLRLSNERYLRERRGQLVSILAPGSPSWALRLSYHLALSVAKHIQQPVALVDLSGRARQLIHGGPSIRSLDDATKAAHSVSATLRASRKIREPQEYLQVVCPENAEEAPTETELVATLKALQDNMHYVFVYVPDDASALTSPLAQADASLVILPEAAAGTIASVASTNGLPKEGKVDAILMSDSQGVVTDADLRRAQSSIGSGFRLRGLVPGGAQALEGDLSPGASTGRAIDRLARSIAGLTVGLALGGGGAKGYAHIGMVRVLQRLGVPFDYVTGSSIGAPIAAGLAALWSLEEIRANLDTISKKAVRPNIPFVSILTSRSIRSELKRLAGDLRFEDLTISLGIVAVDIRTGEELRLRSGLLWPAMVASMAYPGIYEPMKINGRHLVDGALLNPVPVSAAVALGADLVISSNLSARPTDDGSKPRPEPSKRRPFILQTITRSLEIMQRKIVEESSARADVSIEPTFDDPPGLLDFKRGPEIEEAGEAAVERALPKLKSVLPWLS